MYDPNSPILDFYPLEFGLDLNGKKTYWEAVVKIAFIDEGKTVWQVSREHSLTPEEQHRNSWGTSTTFRFNPDETTVYPSSLPVKSFSWENKLMAFLLKSVNTRHNFVILAVRTPTLPRIHSCYTKPCSFQFFGEGRNR
ncbi:hypothetical protein BYT27DRAFT_7076416 [Phlegmacium glaucopus]|nr:hypothetical protein BYT27DRAFT_7076416 [Phlegmacium glaucopus]